MEVEKAVRYTPLLRRPSLLAKLIASIFLCAVSCTVAFVVATNWHFNKVKKLEAVEAVIDSLLQARLRSLQEGRYREVVEALLTLEHNRSLGILNISVTNTLTKEILASTNNARKIKCSTGSVNHSWLTQSNDGLLTLCTSPHPGLSFEIDFAKEEMTYDFDSTYIAASIAFASAMSMLLALISTIFLRFYTRRVLHFTSDALQSGHIPEAFPSEFALVNRSIRIFIAKMSELNKKVEEKERLAAIGQISRQVAHDIRSPLTALRAILCSTELQEDTRHLLAKCISRIENIANDVMRIAKRPQSRKHNNSISNAAEPLGSTASVIQIKNTIEFVAYLKTQEKRGQIRKIDIDVQTHKEMGVGCETEALSRIIDNIFNNSLEAGIHPVTITVKLIEESNHLRIDIIDDGPGISQAVVGRIFDEGFSHGKQRGTGIGLFSAKKTVEMWGGEISCKSTAQGTTLSLRLKWLMLQNVRTSFGRGLLE